MLGDQISLLCLIRKRDAKVENCVSYFGNSSFQVIRGQEIWKVIILKYLFYV